MTTCEPAAQQPVVRIPVAILEDGRYDRLGMVAELNSEPDIELLCVTAQPYEFLTAILEQRPEVVVIDLRIYDDDEVGLGVIRDIKQTNTPVKVVVLTAFPELDNFLTASGLGVEAFLKKAAGEPRPTLGELIRLTAAGGRYYDPDVTLALAQRLIDTLPPHEDFSFESADDNADLSDRELQVLHLLAARRTDQQIADVLVISKHTVKSHIRNISAKLGGKGRREAVLIATARNLLSTPLPAG